MAERALLLVEDDPDDQALFLSACRDAGVASPVVWARDGREAIDLLSGDGPLPALAIVDLKMPRVTGLELLRWIRRESRAPLLPVLMLTASARREDIDESYRLGANAFLVKPSRVQELGELLAAVKVFWLRFNLLPGGSPEAP